MRDLLQVPKSLLAALHSLYYASRTRRLMKPTVLQFPVNDICNSRCQMCRIWRQSRGREISPGELSSVVSSPLFSEIRSVGVNGGEPTLRRDLADLVDILFQELPKLASIALITNGLNSKQVIERIVEVGQVVQVHNGHLDVMISLDGVGRVHDRVRGKEGAFENAVTVVDFVKSSDLVDSCRLGCTVIRENVYGLHDLLEFAISRNVHIRFRLGIPHQRLYSTEITDPFALSFFEKYHIAVFLENLIKHYEASIRQRHFYRSLIQQLMYDEPRAAGCDWQYRGVTLSSRGELLYCAVESDVLGSAICESPEDLYFRNRDHLRDIVECKCEDCMHDYTGLPSAGDLVEWYISRLGGKAKLILQRLLPQSIWQSARRARRRMSFARRKRELESLRCSSSSFSKSMRVETQSRKVLVCGWYGTETLGDKAIIGGIVPVLRENLGEFDLHLASLEPYISEVTIAQMPELEDCRLHSIREAIALVSSMDLVVFGGGPIMAIDPLLEMITIFQCAAENRVPTLVAGCGVGPLGAPYHNAAIRQLLDLATFRVYRDRKSWLIAGSLGVNTARDLVAEDPAFTWLKGQRSEYRDSREGFSLLLGLREWPHNQYAHRVGKQKAEEIKRRFDLEVVATLSTLVDKFPHLRILPFPMCTNHIGGDDRWYYRKLLRGHDRLCKAVDTTYLDAELAPSEAVSVFSDSTVALTMRYHSLVFALALGIPAVSIDYTLGRGKVEALASRHDVPQMRLDRIDRHFMVEQLSKGLAIQQSTDECAPVYPDLLLRKTLSVAFSEMDLVW